MNEPKIRRYFRDYVKWFPNEWRWRLAEGDNESRELYMKFRARRSWGHGDNDLSPCFDSIEKDANQFNLREADFTDFFGIKWHGERGIHRYVGDADYAGHMYYWCPEGENEDDDGNEVPLVSEDVTCDKVPDGFAELSKNGVQEYVDVANAVDVKYKYVVENHLFKDSYVILSYDKPLPENVSFSDLCNGKHDTETVWDVYGIAVGLKKYRPELYEKFLAEVDEHLKALQNSEREEERLFAPTRKDGTFQTAREHFEEAIESREKEDGRVE